MRLVTYNSQNLYLLDEQPDWATSFRVRVSLLSEIEAGLTDREGRRALGETLRLRLEYQIRAAGLESRALAAALRAHRNEPVAAPFWPAACRWADRATADITGGLKVIFPAAGGAPVLYESVEPGGILANDTLVPLVVGNLDARELAWPSDEYAVFDVALSENSPAAWAITPAAYAAPAGPQPAAYDVAPRLFPFLTHWDAPRTTLTLRIEREQIGFGRETSDALRANSNVARTVEQVAWASRADGWSAAKLLRFFADHGAGTSFWACAQHGAARLAADVGANAAAATVDNASGISAGDYLGLVQRGQLVGAFGPIAIAGLALTFPASGCPACPAAITSLSPLILARFDKAELSLTWTTDGFATAAFRVRELPPEIVPPVNETLGLYIGELARRAWLYEFVRDYAGTVVTERVTSYESALEYEGETYAPARISHGEMRQGLALDRDELALDADGLDVLAIRDLIRQRLEVPLVLTVIAAEVTAPGVAENGEVKFAGEVVSGRLRARRVTAKAAPGGSRLDRKHPRFFLQAGCNHNLFSAGCGLDSAAWVHTAVMADPGAAGYPFTFALSGLARAGGPILTGIDSFAGGWLEVGAGATLQRLPIQASGIVSGDAVTLTLARDPAPWIAAATAVRIFPGCDGRKETCAGRFNNFLNFGGHPFVPANNPTLKTISASGGGKK